MKERHRHPVLLKLVTKKQLRIKRETKREELLSYRTPVPKAKTKHPLVPPIRKDEIEILPTAKPLTGKLHVDRASLEAPSKPLRSETKRMEVKEFLPEKLENRLHPRPRQMGTERFIEKVSRTVLHLGVVQQGVEKPSGESITKKLRPRSKKIQTARYEIKEAPRREILQPARVDRYAPPALKVVRIKLPEIPPGKKLMERLEQQALERQSAVEEGRLEALAETRELDFLEILFGEGAGMVGQAKACIIVPSGRRLEDMVATICRDIYREKKGGYPTPYQHGTIKELRLQPGHPIENGVAIVEKIESKEDFEELIRLLKGFYSIDSGFLILPTEKPEEMKGDLIREKTGAPIICFSPMEGFDGALFRELMEKFDEKLTKEFLGNLYRKAPKELRFKWYKLTQKRPIEFGDEPESASDVHSAMKGFVWMHKWKESDGKTEPELEAKINEIYADVSFKGENYEVETFYGVGDPRAKLTAKIDAYNHANICDIRFVLRPISILLHLRDLLIFKRDWKDKINVEIYGINLEKEDLVPIEQIAKEVLKMRKS